MPFNNIQNDIFFTSFYTATDVCISLVFLEREKLPQYMKP